MIRTNRTCKEKNRIAQRIKKKTFITLNSLRINARLFRIYSNTLYERIDGRIASKKKIMENPRYLPDKSGKRFFAAFVILRVS